jgi:hypothetical protein
MKNIVLLLFYLVAISTSTACKSEEVDKFVIIELTVNTKEDFIAVPQLATGDGFDLNEDKDSDGFIVKIKYYDKHECADILSNNAKVTKKTFNNIKDGVWVVGANSSIVADTYVIDNTAGFIHNYLCVPADTWNKMKSDVNNKDELYSKGDEDRFKTKKSFFDAMKSCGLTDFSGIHINIPDTPFICDKYNEKNPVPHKSYGELMNKNKK